MIHGQSTEALAGKNSGSRNRYCDFSVPYSPCRMLLRTGLAGHHSRRRAGYCWPRRLQDLEAQTRFELVGKEGSHG